MRLRLAASLLALVALSVAGAAPRAEWEDARDPGPVSVARQAALPLSTRSPSDVRRALANASKRHEETVARWLSIAEIPALSGQEAERARFVAQLFREAGLPAQVLPDGNVEAVLQGTGSGMPAVIAAHLDVLHVPTKENPVRREGGLVRGPGVLDDASGLAALVASAHFLAEQGYKPVRTVKFVATVSEENGLRGAKSYIGANRDLAAFVSIDGVLGAVDHGATGIQWTRYTMTGRGGHTLLAHRVPSPSFAAGRAVAAIASLAEDTDAPINVGSMEGGTAPNAIPTQVSFVVDVRGDDPAALARLIADIDRVVRGAADREGVDVRTEILQSLPAVRREGFEKHPLVAGTVDILEWLGLSPAAWPRGSSDHNVALLAGIPGIAVGATVGRHAHAPTETADVELLERGVKQTILLVVLLGEGIPEPTVAAAH